MTPPADIEDRLKAALRAQAAGVAPDPGSLPAIRARGRAVRRRRRVAMAGTGVVALAAVALGVPALDGPDRHDGVTTMTSPSTTTPTTAGPDVLAGDVPASDAETALWPDPAGELYTEPVEAARSFVEAILDVEDPPLSRFRPEAGDPLAGEIDVERWSEDASGVSRIGSTLQLRRLDGEHWFVIAATSDDVRIDAPRPLAEVPPSFDVSGVGRGWERAITVELLTRSGTAERLDSAGATGGEFDAALEPFDASLAGEVPHPTVAIVMARDEPAEGMAIPSFAAVPVRLGAAAGEP
jgi:hypothetical protein